MASRRLVDRRGGPGRSFRFSPLKVANVHASREGVVERASPGAMRC